MYKHSSTRLSVQSTSRSLLNRKIPTPSPGQNPSSRGHQLQFHTRDDDDDDNDDDDSRVVVMMTVMLMTTITTDNDYNQ